MKNSVKTALHGTRQAVLVTVVLLLICGFLFPLLLTGISSLIFPSQANGSLISINGNVVGAKNVGQEFTQDYYMWSRPSAYHYNTYTEDEGGNQFYNDGTEFLSLIHILLLGNQAEISVPSLAVPLLFPTG